MSAEPITDYEALVADLRQEVARVQSELDEATSQRVRAAEYGLAVLEEKNQLQQHCENLEALYDTTKHELHCTKNAIDQLQLSQKKVTAMGIRHEELLLEETSSREQVLLNTISNLETELRSTRQILEHVTDEKEKNVSFAASLSQQFEECEKERLAWKAEVKELKARESRIMGDCAELEDENISLQKQLMHLKQAQVDYESTKLELRHVQEELSEMTLEVEAMERLKAIAEQNVTEALSMLQQEREQRHNIKKELDQRIASESMFGLHNLSLLGLGNAHPDGHQTPGGTAAVSNSDSGFHIHHHIDDDTDYNPALKCIEADFSSPDHDLHRPVPAPSQGLMGNLFSEVHVGEIRKLERILEQTEIEKCNLERALEESSARLAEAVAEVAARNVDVTTLKAELEQLSANQRIQSEISGADPVVLEKFPNYESAIIELSLLTKNVEILHRTIQQQSQTMAANPDGLEQPDVETLVSYRDTVNKLEVKYADQCQMADELRTGLGQTKDGLQQICMNLGQFYGGVCEQAGEIPKKALLGNVTDCNGGSSYGQQSLIQSTCDDSVVQHVSYGANNSASVSDLSQMTTGSSDVDVTLDGPPAVSCYKLIEMVQKQILNVGSVFDRLMEKSRGPYHTDVATNVDEVTELQQQLIKLRSMLATKREQIATMRSVLKQNKSTAETALSNLKSKYETEKSLIGDTLIRLRRENKSLRQDLAEFTSQRAMFASRCDEYATQLDELQQQMTAMETEKRTLNSLLRMAVQQKLSLTQQIDDLEANRDRHRMSRYQQNRRGGSRGGGSKTPGPRSASGQQPSGFVLNTRNSGLSQQTFGFGPQGANTISRSSGFGGREFGSTDEPSRRSSRQQRQNRDY